MGELVGLEAVEALGSADVAHGGAGGRVDKAGAESGTGVAYGLVDRLGLSALYHFADESQLHVVGFGLVFTAEREEDAVQEFVLEVGEGLVAEVVA